MIKVAIELNDRGFSGVDIRDVINGNPGIGGSEYLFSLLALYLHEKSDEIDVTILHYQTTNLMSDIPDKIIQNEKDLIDQSENLKCDILIHQVNKTKQWYQHLETTSLKVMSWAHTYPVYEEVLCMEKCGNVRRVIFVGKEEYDAYIDTDLIKKSTYIYNMINTNIFIGDRAVSKPIVTYVGSLVPVKGFHLLAEIWQEIIKDIPNAELNVVGTGRVYDKNAKMGKYGVAQKEYEEQFMPFLTDKTGNVIPSVHFLGILGNNKNEVFRSTKVGVVNPSAKTETFCLSAIEMELCGIPVVSRKKWGLLDTVNNSKTGFLFKNKKDFKKKIIRLLRDDDLNLQMGENARKFVRNTFDVETIIEYWINEIKKVYTDVEPKYLKVAGNYFNDYKIIKILFRSIRFNLKIQKFPSFIKLKYTIQNIVHRGI